MEPIGCSVKPRQIYNRPNNKADRVKYNSSCVAIVSDTPSKNTFLVARSWSHMLAQKNCPAKALTRYPDTMMPTTLCV